KTWVVVVRTALARVVCEVQGRLPGLPLLGLQLVIDFIELDSALVVKFVDVCLGDVAGLEPSRFAIELIVNRVPREFCTLESRAEIKRLSAAGIEPRVANGRGRQAPGLRGHQGKWSGSVFKIIYVRSPLSIDNI